MSDMIERVAEAMAEGNWKFIPEGESRYAEDGLFRDDYRNIARAAINGMRKPTQSMIDAVDLSVPTEGMITEVWDTMIEAALK